MKTKFEKIYVLHCLPDKDREIQLRQKFNYLGLLYEYVYALPLADIFNNSNVLNITNPILGIEKNNRHWSISFGHYMCVYQAYQLGYENVLIFEDDIAINTDKDLIFRYLYDTPEDADVIRYGYMSWWNQEKFNNINTLFIKDNTNNHDNYGCQCYGLMNRKTMKIYLDSCNYCFTGSEDVLDIFKRNEHNLNIYYATKPLFIDHLAYEKICGCSTDPVCEYYNVPYSKELMNKFEFMK